MWQKRDFEAIGADEEPFLTRLPSPERTQAHFSWRRLIVAFAVGTMGLAAVSTVYHTERSAEGGATGTAQRSEVAAFVATENECMQADSGPVLQGTDVVSYFMDGLKFNEFVEGTEEHQATLNGYTFYFSSEKNRATFAADPWRYAPQFGSFCSWGVARETWWTLDTLGASADPRKWQILGGKLYMFRSNVPVMYFLGEGLSEAAADVAQGDKHWSGWNGMQVPSQTSPFNTACFCSPDTCWDAMEDEGWTPASLAASGQ